jgi:Cof subfamily protein (haloacid dehalogenase superfamily)
MGGKNRMEIKLIALDLDGTLMDKSRIIPERTRSAVRRATQKGCLVTIATGRGFESAAHFARELGINAPLICCQGALIQDYRDGTIIHTATIPLEVARDVIAFSQLRELEAQVFLEDGRTYMNQASSTIETIARVSGLQVVGVADLFHWLSRPPLKFMFMEREELVPDLVQELQARFDGTLQVVQSWYHLVEATGPDVSKGEALARLAAHLGVEQAATMAIGDQDNDVSMIAWAGLGVAMGDGSPAAKAVADLIAPSLAAEGAAGAIECHVLGEQICSGHS